MFERLFKNYPLFKECVDDLQAKILPLKESNEKHELFLKMFPISDWGKIDWSKIEKKQHIGCNPKAIVPVLGEILSNNNFDKNVYVTWSCSGPYVIQTNLNAIVEHFDSVTCVAFEKFIFNPTLGYIIEIRTGDDMTVGVIK